MKKLTFVFDKELFGAFQHGDVKAMDAVETAINDFLKGVKTIYIGNGVFISTMPSDVFFAEFDTQHANDDDYIRFVINDESQYPCPVERAMSRTQMCHIPIIPGDELTFKKDDDSGIVSVKLEGVEVGKTAPCDQVEAMAKNIVEIAEHLHIPTVAVINLVTAQTERLEAGKEREADD
jgi:hypothetical protein